MNSVHKKWFGWRIMLLSLALVLVIVMWYLYFIKIPHYQTQYQNTLGAAALDSTQNPPISSTLQTYANTEFGFTLTFPAVATSSVTKISKNKVTEFDIPVAQAKLLIASEPQTLYAYTNIVNNLSIQENAGWLGEALSLQGKHVVEIRTGNNAGVLFKHDNLYFAFIYKTNPLNEYIAARHTLSSLTFTK